jgi:hypothetical protein
VIYGPSLASSSSFAAAVVGSGRSDRRAQANEVTLRSRNADWSTTPLPELEPEPPRPAAWVLDLGGGRTRNASGPTSVSDGRVVRFDASRLVYTEQMLRAAGSPTNQKIVMGRRREGAASFIRDLSLLS